MFRCGLSADGFSDGLPIGAVIPLHRHQDFHLLDASSLVVAAFVGAQSMVAVRPLVNMPRGHSW
jgi:hypothetical protein